MKIQNQGQATTLALYGQKSLGSKSQAQEGEGLSDAASTTSAAVVRLSARAVELARAKPLTMDPARVDQLRADLESGALRAKPAQIADKLLEEP